MQKLALFGSLPLLVCLGYLPVFAVSTANEGLSLRARAYSNTYVQAEPIYITIILTNTSEKKLILPYTLCFPSPFLSAEVFFNGEATKYIGLQGLSRELKGSKMDLPQQQSISYELELTSNFEMVEVGRYTIQITYDAEQESYLRQKDAVDPTLWVGKLTAKPLKLIVREPQGVDKDAYDHFYNKLKDKEGFFIQERNDKYPDRYKSLDSEVKMALHDAFYLNGVNDLLEKFPSSIYTAYALYTKFNLDKKRVAFDPRVKALAKNHELIVRYHPDFIFIDEVYETLGNYYRQEGNPAGAREMFEKALEVTKNAERKVRVGGFLKALGAGDASKETQL